MPKASGLLDPHWVVVPPSGNIAAGLSGYAPRRVVIDKPASLFHCQYQGSIDTCIELSKSWLSMGERDMAV
jgi:hypothetical protein